MKKKVNGKIVDINNLDLFQAAFEGLVINKSVISNITETISDEGDIVNKCINSYNTFYKSMPFPLYSVENNIKYAIIATYIKNDLLIPLDMWVDGALFIELEGKKALKLLSCNWAIVSIEKALDDNTDIEMHSHDIGFREFKWLLSKIVNKRSTVNYYKEFMPNFLDACNNEPMVIKWELNRLLDLGYVAKELVLKDNTVISLDDKTEYVIDIFSSGRQKTDDTMLVIDLSGADMNIGKRNRYVKTYDFNMYSKGTRMDDIHGEKEFKDKMVQHNIDGFGSVFEKIVSKGIRDDVVESIKYRGIIGDGKIIYEVGESLYMCDLNKYNKSVEIARNVSIHGFYKGKVYMLKKAKCASGVMKNTIYAYDIENEKLKLCRISFSKQ